MEMLNHDVLPYTNDLYYTDCFQKNEIMGEVYIAFAKLPTAADKFLYTYNILKKYNKLPMECKLTNPKCNKKARLIRADANVKFQNKDYISAFCEYNKCVMTAKIDSKDFVFALANRSAALYYLEEYEACIHDIHQALAKNYPIELAYKLYEREVKCLQLMGKTSQAKLKFKELLYHLSRASLSKENKKDIEMQIKRLLKETNKKDTNNQLNLIKLLGGPNRNIPALSKFVKMKYSESMGRCLVVSSDINPGDVLAIEKPYAGVLRRESYEYNCQNCFKRCLNGIPCLKCTLVIYCNETCRVKSYENGHKYECSIFSTFNNWPRLDKYIATVLALNAETSDPMMRGFNNGKYLSDQFCSVYTLEGNETKRTVSDLFLRNCYAASMVSIMKLAGLQIPDHQLGTVGESLVHIICAVSSNAHGITQPPNHKTWSLIHENKFMPVASLLMPVLSLLNHHCDPNVVRHNYNGTIVLTAIQPISKNSQIFDNYGLLYATHPKETRQQILKKQYCFHCECSSCEDNWPMYNVLSNQPQSEYIIFTDISSHLIEKSSIKLYEIINKIKTNECDGLQYIQFLYSHLKLLYNNIKRPIGEYCDCQETIKEILYWTANKFIIEDY
ncbi:SET and MYND domain-containing protein 4-like isoform X2 [Melanaphis sacchari]|uniref:SET and MYND domain-containing protein 4-like isoform X2 n=1 Tax=Melanaphis sacchari TaxID=742174 RepID=UPI000DC156D5|nr:SET and MYND domain-containing protein 4-like isoform X2 [Melanaphis sacchari]